jgi:hypothetical protein
MNILLGRVSFPQIYAAEALIFGFKLQKRKDCTEINITEHYE